MDDPSASPHIVTLAHENERAEVLVSVLRENRIICGARNGRVRVSLAPYNNSDDVDAFVEVLAKV